MKKSLLFLFLFTFYLGFTQTKDSLSVKEQQRREKNIQAGNPFKKFGYTPKIHTLSKGKYLEFHDLDSVVRIGSFSYHVKNKTITGYTQYETRYSEATLRPEIISRWFSPDPLSEEFPSWSPYNFVKNNPIRFIDPDGRAPLDIIFLNNNDQEIARIVTNDKTDTYVNIDTDLSLPTPFVIDTNSESSDKIDAVGLTLEGSLTFGGGVHTGIGFVYFTDGKDKGSLFSFDFKGGNVGMGSGVGVQGFISEFNDAEAPQSFKSADKFAGGYNSYSVGVLSIGGSMTWSNTEGSTNELYPGMRHTWTWKSESVGGSKGTRFEINFKGGETKNFKEIKTKK